MPPVSGKVTMRIALICCMLILSSCAGPAKKEPKVAPANLRQELQAAQIAWQNRDSKRALMRLNRILDQTADSDVSDDALMLKGDIFFDQQQFQEAFYAYAQVANGEFATPLEMKASLQAARCLVRLQKPDEAIPYVEKVTKANNLPAEDLLAAYEIRYELLSQQKRNIEALDSLVYLIEKHPTPGKRERFRQLAFETLEGRLTDDELRRVATSISYGFLQAPAKFRFALVMADQKQFSQARQYLDEVTVMVPDTELCERAQTIAQQIDARQKVDPRTIGVVLPLSGKQAAIGYKALRGIQHGLGIYGRTPSQFRLAVIDSEGNPDVARRAVERLVVEDNVIAIIGGLLSKTAAAEASKANEFGVPILTMSQKTGVTQIGEYVFRNAMTSQMQVQRLVDVAMGQHGLSKFAMMYPNDAYGVEFANLFWDEVRARGGTIVGAQPYDPQETDFRGHVQRLVGTYYLDDREDYQKLLKAWHDKHPTQSSRQGGPAPEEILTPIIDFEAVFIPDSAKAVGQIAPMLAYNDVTNVRLLGTNLWNSKNLVERANRFVENSVFVDSFLATDKAFLASEFFNSYKSIFAEEPGVFEVMAHDSAYILRQLIGSGETSRSGLAQRLTQLRDFPGALGSLTVNADRELRRPVIALTVHESVISPLMHRTQ